MPHHHPLFLGLLGMHGARFTNMVLEEADLLLALGVRFDDRATGKACEFCRRADIVHIDIDHSEINKIKPSNISLVQDAGRALQALFLLIDQNERSGWRSRVDQLRLALPLIYNYNGNLRHPVSLIRHIAGLLDGQAVIATDVGQHQMWVAQVYPFSSPRTFLTSGGLGTMGFGLPAAIGAALANPGRKVVCISGDGSFLMNIQELATLAENDLNVAVIIMNNHHLGLVRQQQELFYEGRVFASKFERQPDFASLAMGFGIRGYDLVKTADPCDTLEEVLKFRGPAVINAPVGYQHNVYPMVPPGEPNREMIDRVSPGSMGLS
jgi:acetolactate synthase-1/2/3 large subunit